MARFATGGRPIYPHLPHAIFELTFVRIGVTRGAGAILKLVEHGIFCLRRRFFLMTITTRDRDVPSGKHEPGLLVLRQSESGGPVSFQRMALLTAVEVWSGGELSLVFVFVAVKTARELYLVKRFFTFGDVALCTLHGGMLGLECVGSCRVLFHAEPGGLKAVNGVAVGTLPTVSPLDELPLVLIFMAVDAALEGDRLFEIAPTVTLHAIDALVLAHQRILGFRVVETLIQRRSRNPLPPIRVVATLAALKGKTAAVRIRVAIQTFRKRQPGISRLIVWSWSVTLLTGHLGMQAS